MSDHDHYPDSLIRRGLESVKTIAVVGASANESRPSYFVVKYLAQRGYTVYPVNPGHAGRAIGGLMTYASLKDCPQPIDMVDIFRASDAVPGVVDEALALSPLPKVIWMQLGVRHDAAAATAEAAGLTVIMNRCPKIEIGRLSSEISWMGVNTGTISSRRADALDNRYQRLAMRPLFEAGKKEQ